ncbi:MAG: hypothetical protein HRU20_01180 [Pseudomonadales bacterium]|nr:hypothetical protein [Pseudomonadales bacterium]
MSYLKLIPILSVLLLSSCFNDYYQSGCGESGCSDPLYNISDIKLESGKIINPEGNVGYSYVFTDQILEGESVSPDNYVLSIISIKEEIARAKVRNKARKGFLINSAFATSLAKPYTDEEIVNITIKSNANFSDELEAGSSLNHVFDVIYNEAGSHNYKLENNKRILYNLDEFLEQPWLSAGEVIQLTLNTSPKSGGEHEFTVEYSLDTGEVFTVTSSLVVFK